MQVVSQTPTTTHHNPKSVNASYSRISEAFRHVTAGPLQCQVREKLPFLMLMIIYFLSKSFQTIHIYTELNLFKSIHAFK